MGEPGDARGGVADSAAGDRSGGDGLGGDPKLAPVVPQRLGGEQRQRQPHQRETQPPGERHRLVEHQQPERELDDRGEVLQQPDRAQRHTRVAAAPKNSSGIAVITPVPSSSSVWTAPCWPNVDVPPTCSTAK